MDPLDNKHAIRIRSMLESASNAWRLNPDDEAALKWSLAVIDSLNKERIEAREDSARRYLEMRKLKSQIRETLEPLNSLSQ